MGDVNQYTYAYVATQDGSKNQALWIVYKDSVYDLSKYINEHPGGYDTLMEQAGKDATRAIEDVGHSSDARNIMLKYKIGEIVEEEKRYDANGKKKKRVVNAQSEEQGGRGCLSIITCGLLG